VVGILVVVVLGFALLELRSCPGGSTGSEPAGGPGMARESAQGLAQAVLKRFEVSLELDKLSVEVVGAESRTRATLAFEYYTPLGDKAFRLPVAYRDGRWVASERDLAAIEKRFER